MSFRIEEKINLHKNNLFYIKDWLLKNESKVLFPARIISSVYYDNDNFDMYQNSIEGVLPRKKIRIRFYPNSVDKDFYIETKISSVEGRFKTKKKVSMTDKKIIKSIYDKNYGECKPKVMITYKRDYFFLKNTRVTIDNNIKFTLISNGNISKKKFIFNKVAMELKNNIGYSKDKLASDFPFEVIRFSKYCEAVKCFSLF